MPDVSKFKSVGIAIETYKKLARISKERSEERRVGVSKLVDSEYEIRYGNDIVEFGSKSPVSRGVGSLSD